MFEALHLVIAYLIRVTNGESALACSLMKYGRTLVSCVYLQIVDNEERKWRYCVHFSIFLGGKDVDIETEILQ